MRIDKYLKVSRLTKKRETAKELAEVGRLFINERACKAHNEVKIGDKVKIEYGNRTLEVVVKKLLTNASKEQALSMYELINIYK